MISKLKNRSSNAYAILVGITLIAMIMMGMYVIMDPFAKIYDTFTDNSDFISYSSEESCSNAGGHWDMDTSICKQLETKTEDLMERMRQKWLVAPIIFIFGVLLWIYTQTTKKDYQQFQ